MRTCGRSVRARRRACCSSCGVKVRRYYCTNNNVEMYNHNKETIFVAERGTEHSEGPLRRPE